MYIRTYVCTYIHTYIRTYLRANKQTIYSIDLSSSSERCVWLLCVSTPAFSKPSHTSIHSSLYFYIHRPSSLGRGLSKNFRLMQCYIAIVAIC